jgi:hypothetical protein
LSAFGLRNDLSLTLRSNSDACALLLLSSTTSGLTSGFGTRLGGAFGANFIFRTGGFCSIAIEFKHFDCDSKFNDGQQLEKEDDHQLRREPIN